MSTQLTEVVTIHRRIPRKPPKMGFFRPTPENPENGGSPRGAENREIPENPEIPRNPPPQKICKFSGALKDNRARKVSHFVPTGRVIKYPKKCALFCPPRPGGPNLPPSVHNVPFRGSVQIGLKFGLEIGQGGILPSQGKLTQLHFGGKMFYFRSVILCHDTSCAKK